MGGWDSQEALVVKNPPANAGGVRDTGSLGQEDPLEEELATHSSILARESHGQRSLGGYSPQGHKESDATEVIENTPTVNSFSVVKKGGQRRPVLHCSQTLPSSFFYSKELAFETQT